MNKNESIECKNKLLSTLKLFGEYDEANGLRKKVLLVEGATDKKFIERVKGSDTRCIAVADFMKTEAAFSTSQSTSPMQFNSKEIILMILKDISFYPECFNFPKGAEKWPLYGLVDNDFDKSADYSRTTKLFFTDTHDLETMMMATDSELFSKLKMCSINNDEVKEALYIASQMAALRKAIKKNRTFKVSTISESDGTIAFDAFTDGNKINLNKFLEYINDKLEIYLTQDKLRKVRADILKDLKKQLDKDGVWKKSIESFSVTFDSDFWMDVNGHDIFSAICYINPKIKEVFSNRKNRKLNRDFEFALISAYDYNCLKITKLNVKLQEAGILKK